MLDRLKRQLAEGAFGGADARDPNGMAAAARRAFEDLSAQFAARAGGGPGGERAFAPAAATDREEEAARSVSRFGGLFGGARDSAARSSRSARPETAFGGAAALAGVFDDDAFLPEGEGKGVSLSRERGLAALERRRRSVFQKPFKNDDRRRRRWTNGRRSRSGRGAFVVRRRGVRVRRRRRTARRHDALARVLVLRRGFVKDVSRDQTHLGRRLGGGERALRDSSSGEER